MLAVPTGAPGPPEPGVQRVSRVLAVAGRPAGMLGVHFGRVAIVAPNGPGRAAAKAVLSGAQSATAIVLVDAVVVEAMHVPLGPNGRGARIVPALPPASQLRRQPRRGLTASVSSALTGRARGPDPSDRPDRVQLAVLSELRARTRRHPGPSAIPDLIAARVLNEPGARSGMAVEIEPDVRIGTPALTGLPVLTVQPVQLRPPVPLSAAAAGAVGIPVVAPSVRPAPVLIVRAATVPVARVPARARLPRSGLIVRCCPARWFLNYRPA